MTRPGDRLRAFAARWCCAETMAKIVDPLIADLQHEYTQAIRGGRWWRGLLIEIAAWVAFIKVIVICAWTGGFAWHQWTKEDRRALVRSLAFSCTFIIAFTTLNLLTVRASLLRNSHSTASRLLLYLIPQALTISVTVGTSFGILFGVGGHRVSGRVGGAVLALVLTASTFLVVNTGWILPKANEAYRLATFGGAWMPKFPSELTLDEISRMIDVVRREPNNSSRWHFGNPPLYLRDLRFDYHSRWALSSSPLVFGCLTLLMTRACRRRWLLAIAACGAFFGYVGLAYGGRMLFLSGTMPASVAVWSPNAIFALLTAFLILRRCAASADQEPAG